MQTHTKLPTANGPAAPLAASLDGITTAARRLPTRLILHAGEKWGKTSFAAAAPSPIFLMTRGETGLETLIDAGRLADVPHFATDAKDFNAVKAAINSLAAGQHSYKTLVTDTLNGAARLCEEDVCRTKYGNDWSDYAAYGRGVDAAIAPWLDFLALLDSLRERTRMAIILLCHTSVKTFKNPEGPDYDRYQPDMAAKLWGHTHKWADVILFGNRLTVTEREKGQTRGKAKGMGGTDRVLHTERSAAFDAGNRYGLPPEIDCGASGTEAWANFLAAMKPETKPLAA
jgi:hypothetical protein